jgi:hypothetical protein
MSPPPALSTRAVLRKICSASRLNLGLAERGAPGRSTSRAIPLT